MKPLALLSLALAALSPAAALEFPDYVFQSASNHNLGGLTKSQMQAKWTMDTLETSGLLVGRNSPGVLWHHTDGPAPTRVFAFRPDGKLVVSYKIYDSNATRSALEDISFGPGPVAGENYIYLFNCGNNNWSTSNKTTIDVCRFVEPTIDTSLVAAPPPSPLDAEDRFIGQPEVEWFKVDYPTYVKPSDGSTDVESFDCEAVAIDPIRNEIYFFAKTATRRQRNGGGERSPSRLRAIFRASLAGIADGSRVTMEYVGYAAHDPNDDTSTPGFTGADISADGHLIAVKNRREFGFWYRANLERSVAELFAASPYPQKVFSYRPVDSQADKAAGSESVAFTPDGRTFYSTPEGNGVLLGRFDNANPAFDPAAVSPPAGDATPPAIAPVSPAAGAIAGGEYPFFVDVSDAGGISHAELWVDGDFAESATAAPHTIFYDTSDVADGAHSYAVRAMDAAGNMSELSAPVAITTANNALADPGFEQNAAAWDLAEAPHATVSAAAGDAHGGAAALVIAGQATSERVSQRFLAAEGAPYRATAWLRTQAVPSGRYARVALVFKDGKGNNLLWTDLAAATGTTDYTEYTATVEAPAGTAGAALELVAPGGGAAYLDDCVVARKTERTRPTDAPAAPAQQYSNSTDTDGDGISDADEFGFGLPLNTSNAGLLAQVGGNPGDYLAPATLAAALTKTEALAVFHDGDLVALGPTGETFTYAGGGGAALVLSMEGSENLAAWVPENVTAAGFADGELTARLATSGPRRFFRARPTVTAQQAAAGGAVAAAGGIDTDGDGFSDAFEAQFGLDPNVPDFALLGWLGANVRSYATLDAVRAGVGPRDAAVWFGAEDAVTFAPRNATPQVEADGITLRWRLEQTTDGANWSGADAAAPVAGGARIEIPVRLPAGRVFYRVTTR